MNETLPYRPDWDPVLSELRREYLALPLGAAVRLLPTLRSRRSKRPHFYRLLQTGHSAAFGPGDALAALQSALTAFHSPGEFSFLFVAASSGESVALYLGILAHSGLTLQRQFLESIIQFLESHWVGTRFVEVGWQDGGADSEAARLEQRLAREFDDPQSVLAVTGVPSFRRQDAQSARGLALDRLLNGMRSAPFLYIVVAEPVAAPAVDEIVAQCQALVGEVHLAVRASLTEASNAQASLTYAHTQGTADSLQLSEGRQYTRGTQASLFTFLTANSAKTDSTGQAETHSVNESEARTVGVVAGTTRSQSTERIDLRAQAVETQLLRYVDRFERGRASGCWEVGTYFVSSDAGVAQRAALQLRALLAGDLSYHESIRLHDLTGVLNEGVLSSLRRFEIPDFALTRAGLGDHPATLADRRAHLLGPAFSGLTTPLNSEELSLLVNLPQREVPGIPAVAAATFRVTAPLVGAQPAVTLGQLIDCGRTTSARYRIPIDAFTKHTLVTGINGSGKSTTVRRLLHDLHTGTAAVPFLVIEPAKEEYVAWAAEFNAGLPDGDPRRIAIFSPGADASRAWPGQQRLVINPLKAVWLPGQARPNVLGHMDQLRSILISAFPIEEGDVLPVVLTELIQYVYEAEGTDWLGSEAPDPAVPFPTLATMADNVSKVIHRSYEMRIQGNILAAITTRLKNLRQGWKTELFGANGEATTPWQDLFDRPAVINLSNLEDDSDKCLAMSVILMFLYEYRKAVHHLDRSGVGPAGLRHLTVIEEAHRVMVKGDPSAPFSGRQRRVAEMFANVLSEMRAYGEGLVIADQVPGRLIPDAIKNTNLKIVHRLVANDDREAMAGSMTLNHEQRDMMNRLRPGQAIVFGDMDDAPAWVAVQWDA